MKPIISHELHAGSPIRVIAAGCRGRGKVPGADDHTVGTSWWRIEDVYAVGLEQAAGNWPRRLLEQGRPRVFANGVASP
jgi:hypothetical protein